jgi:hypothetical protein
MKHLFIWPIYFTVAMMAVLLIVLNLPQPAINRVATTIAKNHCKPISAADTITTPHVLLWDAFSCMAGQRPDDAVPIAIMAAAYLSFDAHRLQDGSKEAYIAIDSLRWFQRLMSEEQRMQYAASRNALRSDPRIWQAFCMKMNHIGPPTYYPHYLSYFRPPDSTQANGPSLKTDFDPKQTWRTILTELHCKV